MASQKFYDTIKPTKVCKKCQSEKELSEFHNRSKSPDGKTIYCIPCNKSLMKPKSKELAVRDTMNYAKRHPEKIKKAWADYYSDNKEKLASKRKIAESTPERKVKISSYVKRTAGKRNTARRLRRLNPTPKMILEKSLRDRFYKVVIRCKSGTKHQSCIELIGCDFETFKQHIETQFQPGMSWMNHGNGENKWNIDHIRPLCTFDLYSLEEQKEAFHFTNLRPIWFKENISRERKSWKLQA